MITHITFINILYFLIAIIFGLNGINPSDPLEYIIPAVNNSEVFPYLDRLTLGVIIKLTAIFFENPATLSWLVPASISSILFAIASIIICKESSIKNSYGFLLLNIVSPFSIATFSYLYPSTLVTLFILIGVLSIIRKNGSILAGLLTPIILLTKIQAVSYLVTVISNIKDKESIKKYIIGLSLGVVIYFVIVSLAFNDLFYIYNALMTYINNYLEGQVKGYGGQLPPFSMYLIEPYIIFIAATLATNKNKNSKIINNILIAAISQFIFLYFVYVVTARGGALIPNYIAPTIYLLGIVAAIKINWTHVLNIKTMTTLSLLYGAVLYFVLITGGRQYFATQNSILEFVFSIAIVWLIYKYNNLNGKMYLFIFMVLVGFSYKSQSENFSRNKWSLPYEKIYKEASNNGAIKYSFDDPGYVRRISMIDKLFPGKNKFCDTNCLEDAKSYLVDSKNNINEYLIKIDALPEKKYCSNVKNCNIAKVYMDEKALKIEYLDSDFLVIGNENCIIENDLKLINKDNRYLELEGKCTDNLNLVKIIEYWEVKPFVFFKI